MGINFRVQVPLGVDILIGGEGRQVVLEHRMFGPCPDLQNTGAQGRMGDKSPGKQIKAVKEDVRGCQREKKQQHFI